MAHHAAQAPEVTVRLATPSDSRRLLCLAALDSASVPHGELLVAESEAHIVAALSLGGGPPIADPFRRTSALVQMLELRADQLRADPRVVAKPSLTERLRGRLHRPQAHTP